MPPGRATISFILVFWLMCWVVFSKRLFVWLLGLWLLSVLHRWQQRLRRLPEFQPQQWLRRLPQPEPVRLRDLSED